MPKLRSATTDSWPTKVNANALNAKIVTRQRPTTLSLRATLMPTVSCRSPRDPADANDAGGGRITTNSESTTKR